MSEPLRILIAALGGEGGGVLMSWIVEAARQAGRRVQATSVPGVAQRTGATSYYIEIAPDGDTVPVLGLVPMPGRVDVLVSSELMETGRVLAGGFVSPERTVVISSTARTYSVAEKISMTDGRYSDANVRRAVEGLAREHYLLDLGALAATHGTFVSATMLGALAGSGALPVPVEVMRAVLGEGRGADASRAGFDAARVAVARMRQEEVAPHRAPESTDVPRGLAEVLDLGRARCVDFQDESYGALYRERADRLCTGDLSDHRRANAVTEACRRLALWMAYEDVARVADLKTRPERFDGIRAQVELAPGQVLVVTEYLKPRAEEIADILPQKLGARLMARVEAGRGLPFLGRGLRLRSNGVVGYRLLRAMAGLRRIRRRSYRFAREQAAIEHWLVAMEAALSRDVAFAEALAELPRVLKGYSDTLLRGQRAYGRIMETVVRPALGRGTEAAAAPRLRAAVAAALADDTHGRLDAVLSETAAETAPA